MPAYTHKPHGFDDSMSGMIVSDNKSSDKCYSTCYVSESGGDNVIFEDQSPDLDCEESIPTEPKFSPEGERDNLVPLIQVTK